MKKSKWLLILSLALALTMSLGSTLAYLTDVDSETNTFTMGKVDIELEETFDQNANLWPGQQTNKDASIKNEGATSAWVWMTVVVPANLKDYVTPVWANDTIANSVTTATDADGNLVYTYLVPTTLAAGESTGKILDAMKMSALVDIRSIDGVDYWVVIVDGEPQAIAKYEDKLDVTVYAYAVQEQGFAKVEDAYKAYNDQYSTATQVGTLEELKAAVAEGGNIKLTADITLAESSDTIKIPEGVTVVLDLNGKTISPAVRTGVIYNYGTLTIKNGTVIGANQLSGLQNYNLMTIDGVTIEVGDKSYPYAIGNSGNPNVEPDKIAQLTIKGNTVVNGTIKNWYGTIQLEGDETEYTENKTYTVTQNTDGTWTVTAK